MRARKVLLDVQLLSHWDDDVPTTPLRSLVLLKIVLGMIERQEEGATEPIVE
jgi:hypothetical protein